MFLNIIYVVPELIVGMEKDRREHIICTVSDRASSTNNLQNNRWIDEYIDS